MTVFDASSIVLAWDDYPIDQFPSLWDWIEERINAKDIVFSAVTLEEVSHVSSDCHDWLQDAGVESIPVSSDILNLAAEIKDLIGIEDDNCHPDGVDENDIILIATGKLLEHDVVSDEAEQKTPPQNPRRKKVPAVCATEGIDVQCKNFVRYFKDGGAVFG